MKKEFALSAILLFIATSVWSQTPQGIKYQAVIRDNNNAVIANQSAGIQISILESSTSGNVIYQETFTETTNAYGLIHITIGKGNVTTGDFTQIDWENAPYFIETAVDQSGGTNYAVLGVSEILSVPYALYAEKSTSSYSSFLSETATFADTALYALNSPSAVSDSIYFQATSGWGGQSVPGTNYSEYADFSAEVLDPSNNYDPQTSTFTAPADGLYFMHFHLTVKQATANGGGVIFGFIINNAAFPDPATGPITTLSPAQYVTETVVPVSGLLDLKAGDTVRVGMMGADNGENFNISYSSFSGYKVR